MDLPRSPQGVISRYVLERDREHGAFPLLTNAALKIKLINLPDGG